MTDDELARRYQAREGLASLAAAAGMSTPGVHAAGSGFSPTCAPTGPTLTAEQNRLASRAPAAP